MAEFAVREIGLDQLDALAVLLNAVGAVTGSSAEDLVDWRRQAEDMVWLGVAPDGATIAGGVALVGWHNPRHIGIVRLGVDPAHRRRGFGSAVFVAAAEWLRARGATDAETHVREDDPESLEWAERRGFSETSRNSLLALAVDDVEAPAPAPPPGITIVPWSERPELARGMFEVAAEGIRDIPGNEDDDIGTFDEWLSRDMQGASDRMDATFVAVAAGDEVVGFAKLSLGPGRQERAFHDLTAVRRGWRGRGIAAALKRTQIAWAKANGVGRLETFNEERNEPIRRLNQRHGYRVTPGQIVLRGPLAP